MEAERIRELLAAPSNQVAEAAQRVELPLPIARELRVQALNLIQGKCVLCGKPTPAGMCRVCKRKDVSKPVLRTTRAKLLKKLNPNDVILRTKCVVCDEPFEQTVAFALKMLEAFHRFDPAKTCPQCKRKKKPIEEKEPVGFRPLEGNEVLLQAKEQLRKQKRRRKRAQKVKKQSTSRA